MVSLAPENRQADDLSYEYKFDNSLTITSTCGIEEKGANLLLVNLPLDNNNGLQRSFRLQQRLLTTSIGWHQAIDNSQIILWSPNFGSMFNITVIFYSTVTREFMGRLSLISISTFSYHICRIQVKNFSGFFFFGVYRHTNYVRSFCRGKNWRHWAWLLLLLLLLLYFRKWTSSLFAPRLTFLRIICFIVILADFLRFARNTEFHSCFPITHQRGEIYIIKSCTLHRTSLIHLTSHFTEILDFRIESLIEWLDQLFARNLVKIAWSKSLSKI